MMILRMSPRLRLTRFGLGWLSIPNMRVGLGAAVGLAVSPAVFAVTPNGILQALTVEARQSESGFSLSAARGEHLFRHAFKQGEAEACTTCHTQDARNAGQHMRTHKVIEPLAPASNPQRFTDRANVEKWFKRNCKEVLSRTCTSAEKADFVAYMLTVR